MKKLVEMKNITKKFPGVTALDNIDLEIFSGEVHILVGENGAGKSTLMKILSGIYSPTDGVISINDKQYKKLSPSLSQDNGISIIYQELSVIDELSIMENLFVGNLPEKKILGIPFIDSNYIKEKATEAMDLVGLQRNPMTAVEDLSISEKQLVEIAKALIHDTEVLIMDEPTSSLTVDETENLFNIIRNLKTQGVGIVYISHKLDEIKQIGDRITVLKDGKFVATKMLSDVKSKNEIITMMVGRELQENYNLLDNNNRKKKEILFKLENVTRADSKVKNVSLELYKNEILGFAGLVGSGRTELMNVIFGVEKMQKGKMFFENKELKINTPYDAVKKGLAYLTENRRQTGFFDNFTIWENIAIENSLRTSKYRGTSGFLDTKNEQVMANKFKEQLDIRATSIYQNISELSGGNQQKTIVAKWLAANAKLFIFDEPTRGIDVGAKSEIYKIMRKLVEEGKGVLMISSELPELLAVCDRIVVFNEGQIATILDCSEATEEKIMHAAT
ncbi:MAG: sugar ABC transporter ATP-binding protein [Saccharofermentanales bacterium]|jgi:D-allose transport system ATP-binding protein